MDERETEDFMSSLLSNFGSAKKPTAASKGVAKSKIIGTNSFSSRSRINDGYVSVKKEEEILDDQQQSAMLASDTLADDNFGFDYDDDFGMEDNLDLMMLDDQKQEIKKEVVSLSVSDTPLKPNFTTTSKDQAHPDLQNWQAAEATMMDTFTQDAVREETQKMDVFEKDGHLHMWWYDAYERKEKGYVYLFGKVLNRGNGKYVSCCVVVKNIERNLFFLPRNYELDTQGQETSTEVDMSALYSEVSDLCSQKRITRFASKQVTRKYAFELQDVPAESEYLKVLYDYEQPAFTGEEKGRTFSRVFGANTGPLEHFLVKRDIMGPCWLDLSDAKISSTSVSTFL